MNIKKIYEASLRIRNKQLSSLCYKAGKVIVNLFYPLFGKVSYGLDPNSNVIISLTSYTARIDTVHLTIKTLLNQTVKPKAVILWLAKEQFPEGEKNLPGKLTELKSHGLSIRFCEDLKPHKKYYHTMLENPDSCVITVDDDVFYPEDLVEMLLATAKKFPDTVVCTWGHEMAGSDGQLLPVNEWEYSKKGTEPSFSLMPTGVGGVLYPPHVLSEEVFNKDAIRAYTLNTDDLWLKAMALLNGKKAVRVDRPAKLFFSIIKTSKTGLYYKNALGDNNESSWNKIIEAYPDCLKPIAVK